MSSDLIYGKDKTEGIINIEYVDGNAIIHRLVDGEIKQESIPHELWILHKDKPRSGRVGELSGRQDFRYFTKHHNEADYSRARSKMRWGDYYAAKSHKENYMLRSGATYYKGLKMDQVSILSFDIETSGLKHGYSSNVFLISNTFRSNGKIEKKLFSVDDYTDCKEMIYEWANWVRTVNPSIITGHNIIGFDLPYLNYCSGGGIYLGSDCSKIKFDKKSRQFRKDGSQSYEYNNARIFGREIVDTWMLSIKFDIGRKYPSYRLKEIIAYEGLEKKDRVFYDAASIGKNWDDPVERAKIKAYCVDDSDDSLSLIDIMLPSFFYYTQTLPMGLQDVILTASGSQVNSIMVRSYLQSGSSIPSASNAVEYQGAISFGNPGLYKHVNKVDVASLYPSIIISDKLQDLAKDPQGHFLTIVTTLTKERLANKKLAKDTGDRHYKDLEQAQKIIINSAYGFLGAQGLNYNYPRGAAQITKRGREILELGMHWADMEKHNIVNVDTDSFSYTTGARVSEEDFQAQIDQLNSTMKDGIVWENDGQYKTVLVVKAKNYVLEPYKGKTVIKGSSLKATMKEPALKEFIGETLELLLKGQKDKLITLYNDYATMIYTMTDIAPWCSRKTVTRAVLDAGRTQEARILDAIGNKPVSEGDKIHVFFETKTKLSLLENYSGLFCYETLLGKLYNTVKIFENVIDVDMIPNYKLKRNKDLLTTIGEMHETIDDNADLIERLGGTRTIRKIQGPVSDNQDKVNRLRIVASKAKPGF